MGHAAIHAILGPTNTGKTHRAIERMLEHGTGMLGFPLRLLAREVYDRVCARVGREDVALVTGEEKIVPRTARYFVCTVEAMPMSRTVEFLAVDEVQLAAHEQRGHLFTERILDARGTSETWFLGSDSMRAVLRDLVPTALVSTFARLSRLSYSGADNLPKVPPRSAIVAFSLPEVYALAERIRVRRGGAAVVAGALSPRTRNAQVALFQEGAVDFLVATDAIGMGLNLDVAHVAFASLRKFDGREVRALDDAETGQIAGRAGRHLRDGTFGTVRPALLDDATIFAVEQHRVAPVRKVYWRSSDLDFTSTETLLASLQVPPARPRLRAAPLADDQRALEALLARDASLGRLRGAGLHLLWDVCKIPDFRKLLFEHHVRFLADLHDELREHGGVARADWLQRRIAPLDDVLGEVDDLTARIAETRLYTYVANQGSWVHDADTWRARTTALEDRLSDALHDKLVQRFVEGTRKSPVVRMARARGKPPPVEDDAPRLDPGNPFAALLPLRRVLRDARLDSTPNLVTETDDLDWLLAQDPADLDLGEVGEIRFSGRTVGVARRGPELGAPSVTIDLLLHKDDRAAAERFVQAALRTRTAALFPRLYEPDAGDAPALRGAAFRVAAWPRHHPPRRARGRPGARRSAPRPPLAGHAWAHRSRATRVGRQAPARGIPTRRARPERPRAARPRPRAARLLGNRGLHPRGPLRRAHRRGRADPRSPRARRPRRRRTRGPERRRARPRGRHPCRRPPRRRRPGRSLTGQSARHAWGRADPGGASSKVLVMVSTARIPSASGRARPGTPLAWATPSDTSVPWLPASLERTRMRIASVALALTASFALFACASDPSAKDDAPATDSDSADELRVRGQAEWFYSGPLPALEEAEVVVSLKGHTARATGYLPAGVDIPDAPHIKAVSEDGRIRIHAVYPIATGATYSAAAGVYHFERAIPYRPDGNTYTTSDGDHWVTWGGFPFLGYNGTIAMHGPITPAGSKRGDSSVWFLRRGKVSSGCNRMMGEHVTELANLVGIDMRKFYAANQTITPRASAVTLLDDYDQLDGKYVDVDFPTDVGVVRPGVTYGAENVTMFGSWVASEMPDGSDLPADLAWEGGVTGKRYVFKEHATYDWVCSALPEERSRS